jgi:hypothetical protein
MSAKLLLTTAAAACMAWPAVAQYPPAVNPDAAIAPPVINERGATQRAPVYEAPPFAQTGEASNVSANVSDADLRAGARISDPAGLEVGKIAKVHKEGGQTMVTISAGGKTTTVPASSLTVSSGALVSTASKAEVWSPK